MRADSDPRGQIQAKTYAMQPEGSGDPGATAQLVMRSGVAQSAIAAAFAAYDVIAFDVFDMLLAHRLPQRADFFAYLGRLSKARDFVFLREKAEVLARVRFAPPKAIEVGLPQIYEILTDILPDLPVQPTDELRAESALTFADPAILPLVALARAAGKRVVGINNSSRSAGQVAALLASKAVQLDAVYSAPAPLIPGRAEFADAVFQAALSAEGVARSQILHLRAALDVEADVEAAQPGDISTHFIKTRRDLTRERLLPFFPPSLPPGDLTAALIRGQIEAHMPQLSGTLSDVYAFGYCYAGPLLAGFAKFLEEQARQEDVGQLILLTPEGPLLAEALRCVGADVPPLQNLPISPRSALLALLSEDGEAGLAQLGLWLGQGGAPKSYCARLGLGAHEIVPGPDFERIVDGGAFLAAYGDQLSAIARPEYARLQVILAPWLKAEKPQAVVGFGQGGVPMAALQVLFGPKFKGFFAMPLVREDLGPNVKEYFFEARGKGWAEEAIKGPFLELLELVFSAADSDFALQRGDRAMTLNDHDPRALEWRLAAAELHRGARRFLEDTRGLWAPLGATAIKQYCRTTLTNLLQHPTQVEFRALAKLPLAPLPGLGLPQTIGDVWKPVAIRGIYDEPPKLEKNLGPARRALDRFELLAPTALKKLARRADLEKLNWRKEMLKHPFNLTHWLSLLRYARRRKAR